MYCRKYILYISQNINFCVYHIFQKFLTHYCAISSRERILLLNWIWKQSWAHLYIFSDFAKNISFDLRAQQTVTSVARIMRDIVTVTSVARIMHERRVCMRDITAEIEPRKMGKSRGCCSRQYRKLGLVVRDGGFRNCCTHVAISTSLSIYLFVCLPTRCFIITDIAKAKLHN